MSQVILHIGNITDRTQAGDGDCIIVTGSIGPQFEPLIFKRESDAMAYARHICKAGKKADIWPEFKPVIECRWSSDFCGRFAILESFDKNDVWNP